MALDDCKDFVTSHMVMVDKLKKPNMILASISWGDIVKYVLIKKIYIYQYSFGNIKNTCEVVPCPI